MNVFYIPALLLILFFVLWPLIEAFRISFTQWNGYSQDYKYIGLKNYLKLFKDSNFLIAFRNTIIYGFGSTPVSYTHLIGIIFFESFHKLFHAVIQIVIGIVHPYRRNIKKGGVKPEFFH